ncbi:MAG: hypothetical protein JNM94_16075 [Phycisphaerae bacterium]|nr:hypothetical protein [Phycisphaerae bacterium]
MSCPPPGCNGDEAPCCDAHGALADSFRRALAEADPMSVASVVQQLVEHGALCADPEPFLYVYRIARGGERQIGVVAITHRDDIEGCVDAAPAWREPAVVGYDDPNDSVAVIACDDMNERPIFHFNAGDGTTHTAWLVREPTRYVRAFEALESRGRLLRPGAHANAGEVLTILVANVRCDAQLGSPRCGLFVPRTVLAR